jgi:hypothetical protein
MSLTCDGDLSQSVDGAALCSGTWIDSVSPTLEDFYTVLTSIDDFDLTVIASLISGYLLFFSLGYIGATVAKVMKKA